MNIALGTETKKLLKERLKDSGYATADELVLAALQALKQLEAQGLDEPTLDAIDQAEDQIDRGEYSDWKNVRQKIQAKFLRK